MSLPWPVHPAADLFPLLGDTELTELAEDVETHGLLEPVWLYDDPDRGTMLLDGRNRALACQRAGVEIGNSTRVYTGNDPIGFSVARNMKRRHLTTGQKAAVGAGTEALYASEAAKRRAQAPGRSRGEKQVSVEADRPQQTPESNEYPVPADEKDHPVADRPQDPDKDESPPPGTPDSEATIKRKRREREERKSRERAAKAAGTSGRSLARFKRVENEAPDLAEKVATGDLALDRAERIIRDREAEARRIAEAKRDAEAAEEKITVDIRHGDFRDVLADAAEIDAIITDPPYPHEFIPLLGDLAKWADRVLTPDGVLCVLIGQTYLPEVYRLLDGHRPYRWTGCYLTGGAGYVSRPRKVQSNWKPLLVYGGGPRFGDVIRSEGTDANAKALHKWGQDYSAFHTIVDRFTTRGHTVADPFMGAGTTLLAARALGRHTIGCDIDAEHVATARDRLS